MRGRVTVNFAKRNNNESLTTINVDKLTTNRLTDFF